MSKSQNYYAVNKKNFPVNLNIIAAYHSIVGPNYKNKFPESSEKNSTENAFSGFIHCIDGEGIIKTKKGNLIVKKNHFCFIKNEEIIEFRNAEGKWTFFCVWFTYTALTLRYNEVFDIEVTENEHSELFRMISLLHSNNQIDQALANSICQLFICQTLKQIGTVSLSSETSERMQKVATYIHENLHNDISESKLATMCGYCNNHFRSIFKKYFNLNPKDYILKVKLEKAAFLLIHSNESVSNISEELNFYSPSHFISCFKKRFGFTPVEYRKKNHFTI